MPTRATRPVEGLRRRAGPEVGHRHADAGHGRRPCCSTTTTGPTTACRRSTASRPPVDATPSTAFTTTARSRTSAPSARGEAQVHAGRHPPRPGAVQWRHDRRARDRAAGHRHGGRQRATSRVRPARRPCRCRSSAPCRSAPLGAAAEPRPGDPRQLAVQPGRAGANSTPARQAHAAGRPSSATTTTATRPSRAPALATAWR